jgi:hypothetical protein
MTFYGEMVDTTEELMAEFGQNFTVTAVTSGAYSPSTGAATTSATTQTAVGIEELYKAREIDGTLIKAGDRRLLISPRNSAGAALTTPSVGHTVTLDGEPWRIERVEPLQPGGTVVAIYLHLRKG